MSNFPDVFIQIHYHLRAGGVSTVIRRYDNTFWNCADKKNAASFIICNNSENSEYNKLQAKIVNVAECEYQAAATAEDFTKLRNVLVEKLSSILSGVKGRQIVVVAHNMTLAKNPALSSAFYHCVKIYSKSNYRFYSVIHDYAEEGRVEQLDQLLMLERAGVSIRKELYCIGVPVHFIALNEASRLLLERAGFSASLLSNPVNTEKYGITDDKVLTIRKQLHGIAKNDCIAWNPQKKIYYYPVRLITRKNICEAMVLSCIASNAVLITGPSGTSEIDSRRFSLLTDFIRKHRLSVLFDAGRIAAAVASCKEHVVESLMAASDIIVSTSIAEGFGYALYEPWIQEKPLIARKPSGFIPVPGQNVNTLYSRFPVPSEWVNFTELEKKYKEYYFRCYQETLPWDIHQAFCQNETIDFAVLNEEMQLQIINRVLNDPVMEKEWVQLLEMPSNGWPGVSFLHESAEHSIGYHGNLLRTAFSLEKFMENFCSCFSKVPLCIPSNADFNAICKKNQSSLYFRLLLSGQG